MNYFKKVISILLVISILTIAIPATMAATKFTDMKSSDWYYSYVNRLVDTQITSGIGNNKFGPNNTLTRAEFVTFLDKATGLAQQDGYTYSDTQNHWAKEWISAAVAANIIDKGTSFNPNKAISRQEAVEMLCRALPLQPDTEMATPFSDVYSNPGYSNRAYEEYLMLGSISNGKRYFYPASTLKRGETAAVIVNLLDYKADTVIYKAKKKVEVDKQNQDMNSYTFTKADWQDSVKGIPPELLSNNNGINKGSLYECNKYLKLESGYLSGWGKDYGLTDDEMAKEIVRVGNDIMNLWYNADYRKLNDLENGFRKLGETNFINNSMKRNLDYVKNNKFVAEGNFKTSTGLIVVTDSGSLALRGTIKYRYLSPTSSTVLESETVGSTGKHIELGVWYEQDYQISFYPEKDGLKFTMMRAISDIRIAK